MSTGRYRLRTSLRGRLPGALIGFLPKGRRDCGAHEWYRADGETWRCYHCRPALATSTPWTREEQLQHALGGINSTLRALAMTGKPGGEQELVELRRLIGEVLAVLPEEGSRLERLAAAPASELPGLVQALQAH
ncbi:MAG: hypothetical protein ACRDK4_07230 [Solirubrobacteraceae bacterium]